jgi:glycosyltransferase involved in cell wall biosynthesis
MRQQQSSVPETALDVRVAVDAHMLGQPQAGDAGNGRYAARLVAALLQTASPGDEVAALLAYQGADDMLPAAAVRLPVPAGNLARLGAGAARALRTARVGAALFHYVGPLRPSCPTLLVIHDVSFRLFPQWLDRRARIVLNTLVPAAVRRSRLLIAVSHAAKEDIVVTFGVDPDRVRVIRTHPDPVFSPRISADRHVRERFGLGRYVLAVGDVNPRKNLPALAAAVRRLGDPDLELALVGRPGRDGQAILAECRGRWLGEVTDEELADLYAAATVTCYPSLYEGLGIPVLEAMACGSPVVASRRGAIPEAAGEAAILVEPVPDAIAEGLRAAMEPATRERLASAGPRQAATFSAQATGEAGWAAFREAAT